MTTIYFILCLAKEINGDFVSSTVEFVTANQAKAEEYFISHQSQEQVMNIENHLCMIYRTIIPAELDQEYKLS